MIFWDYLSIVFGAGVVSFLLFLMGYAGYSIIKRGKIKRLREQQRYERMEAQRMENYFRSIDDDLKREINDAVFEHNKRNGINNSNDNKNNNNDLANELLKKVKGVLSDKIAMWLDKGEEKYRIFNEKYRFDENYENLDNIKQFLRTGMNKFADNIKNWEQHKK